MARHPELLMKSRAFKSSRGSSRDFDTLQVRECKEIVALGISPEVLDTSMGGQHLTPEQFHKCLGNPTSATIAESSSSGRSQGECYGNDKDRGDEKNEVEAEGEEEKGNFPSGLGPDTRPLLIDCRNIYEWKVGMFDKAILPPTRQFSDFPKFADELIKKYNLLGNSSSCKTPSASSPPPTAVMMYCTGGIRCERGSAYLKSRGVANVYQLEGGIHRYLERYPDGGHFKGKLFVFDKRRLLGIRDNAEVVGRCEICRARYDKYENNVRCVECRSLALICPKCRLCGTVKGETDAGKSRGRKVDIEQKNSRMHDYKCDDDAKKESSKSTSSGGSDDAVPKNTTSKSSPEQSGMALPRRENGDKNDKSIMGRNEPRSSSPQFRYTCEFCLKAKSNGR
eukprot:jgi/Bigna1/90966/estExt_fgenesh1_pg.C_840033